MPTTEAAFYPSAALKKMTISDWENLTPEKFDELFSDSAVARVGYKLLKRNIDFVKGP
jgi:epoxyqueuosine reductase QueG